jgi:hypothetical protein
MYNPVYLNDEGTVIRLTVSDDDVMIIEPRTDPVLFNEAVAGKYGAVGAYVPDVDDGPVVVEVTCTRLQAKAALMQMGLLAQVEALIAAMDPLTQLAWAEASTYKRSSPLLNALAEYVTWPDGSSLSTADMDELFSIAQTIEV